MSSPFSIVVDGDIFSIHTAANTIVVGHGVNVAGVMGAGFAKQVADRFPQVKAMYQQACGSEELTPGNTQITYAGIGFYIANIASQDLPGKNARVEWMASALDVMYRHMIDAPHTRFDVRLPLIGAGIGGLSPDQSLTTMIRAALRNRAPNISTTLYLRSADFVYAVLQRGV